MQHDRRSGTLRPVPIGRRASRANGKAISVGRDRPQRQNIKMRRALARTLMYEAAVVLMTRLKRASGLKEWAQAIARRSGAGKARAAQVRQGRRPPRQRRVLDRTEHAGILVHAESTTQGVVRNRCRVSNLLVGRTGAASAGQPVSGKEHPRRKIVPDRGAPPGYSARRAKYLNIIG